MPSLRHPVKSRFEWLFQAEIVALHAHLLHEVCLMLIEFMFYLPEFGAPRVHCPHFTVEIFQHLMVGND